LRLESVKPALSLEPGEYLIGGEFMLLYLVNDGGTARDVRIDVSYENTKESHFVPSISKDEKCIVIQNASDLHKRGSQVNVCASYKDAYGKKHSESLSIDFGKLKKEGRANTLRIKLL